MPNNQSSDTATDKIRALEAENKKLREEIDTLKARLERRELLRGPDKTDVQSNASRKRGSASSRPKEIRPPAETLLFNEAERLICQVRNKKIHETTSLSLSPSTVARIMVDKYINRIPLVTQAQQQERAQAQEQAQESAQERAQESAHERTQENAQERAQESAQERAQESAQERAQESAQEQAQESAQEQAQEKEPKKEQGYKPAYKPAYTPAYTPAYASANAPSQSTATLYTIANEMLQYTDMYLKPMYQLLRRCLLHENLLFTRETATQMMDEPYRTVVHAARMRVFQTHRNTRHPIVLYDYRPSHPGQGLTSFLEQYKGYLQVQCHNETYDQPAITAVSCWANARNKLNEAIEITDRKNLLWLDKGMEYCNRIFKLDHSFHNFPPEKRYKSRLKLIKPIADEFYQWIQKNRNAQLTHFGVAIQYLSDEWPYLMNLFRDGRFELTVNCMNHLIKPFIIGRKNWYFSDNSLGAEAGAIICTIIETARVNGLDPHSYICYLFDRLPTEKNTPKAYQPYLPWQVAAATASSTETAPR